MVWGAGVGRGGEFSLFARARPQFRVGQYTAKFPEATRKRGDKIGWAGSTAALLGMLAAGIVRASELVAAPAATNPPVDVRNLPVNQWVARPLTGFKALRGIAQSDGTCDGFLYVPDAGGIVACGDDALWIRMASAAPKLWRLDLEKGLWEPMELPAVTNWPRRFEPGMGSYAAESFWGMQACFDAKRKRLVGITSTALSLTAKTVELGWTSKQWSVVQAEPSPPVLTAASLCHDPINGESVLATGGFSPVGGTDGTWLFDGAGKWRRLEGPKEIEAVRVPLEDARDRLTALRWLAWKNIEFRATGRENRLDARAKSEALAGELAELVRTLKPLAELATANSAKAERPYHKGCLAAAGTLLGETVGKLESSAGRFTTGRAEDLEALYRGNILPAVESVEKAVAEIQITPEPRMNARLVYDPKNRLIICFGGDGQSRMWGDTWVYHCDGRWWERRHPATHPAPGTSRAMAFDERNGVAVRLERIVDRNGYYHGWRFWCYNAGANVWTLADAAFDMKSFGASWLAYDATAGCLVAFNEDLSHAWALKLDLASARALEIKAAPEVVLNATDGDSVLRDAATLKDLQAWKTEQDAWAKSVPARTWVEVPRRGIGRPNGGRTWSSIVYDPDRLAIYYRDGGHGSYHGAVTDHYDLPTGRWFRGARRDEPCWPMATYFCWGRSFSGAPWSVHTYKHAVYYDPVSQRLLRSANKALPDRSAILSYDPDIGMWAREPFRTPEFLRKDLGFRPAHGCRTNLVLTRVGTGESEAVEFTSAGLRRIESTGALPATGYPAWENVVLQYDPKRNRVLCMGPGKVPNELWILDLARPGAKWANAVPKTVPEGAPRPESGREMVYIPKYDVFLMPDGAKDKFMTEMCVYHPAENVWSRFAIGTDAATAVLAKRASGDRSNGMVYAPESDLCYFIAAANSAPPMYAFRYVPDAAPPPPPTR
jgi:hypothetical protein